jgi:phosphoribosylformylglycinamidine synthase
LIHKAAIANSLHALHYDEITDVRMGKYLELRLNGLPRPQAEQRVEEMCRRLLANSVIEDFRFEIVEE